MCSTNLHSCVILTLFIQYKKIIFSTIYTEFVSVVRITCEYYRFLPLRLSAAPADILFRCSSLSENTKP